MFLKLISKEESTEMVERFKTFVVGAKCSRCGKSLADFYLPVGPTSGVCESDAVEIATNRYTHKHGNRRRYMAAVCYTRTYVQHVRVASGSQSL